MNDDDAFERFVRRRSSRAHPARPHRSPRSRAGARCPGGGVRARMAAPRNGRWRWTTRAVTLYRVAPSTRGDAPHVGSDPRATSEAPTCPTASRPRCAGRAGCPAPASAWHDAAAWTARSRVPRRGAGHAGSSRSIPVAASGALCAPGVAHAAACDSRCGDPPRASARDRDAALDAFLGDARLVRRSAGSSTLAMSDAPRSADRRTAVDALRSTSCTRPRVPGSGSSSSVTQADWLRDPRRRAARRRGSRRLGRRPPTSATSRRSTYRSRVTEARRPHRPRRPRVTRVFMCACTKRVSVRATVVGGARQPVLT